MLRNLILSFWLALLGVTSSKSITLIATGDVMPGRAVNIQVTKLNNYLWPYERVAEVLKSADLVFINLETPLIKDCPLISEGFKFCGSDKNIQGLIFAGIDVATLANNHAQNFGTDGQNYTENLLTTNGILATGINGPVYKDIQGVKFAFLGYNDIGANQEIQAKSEIAMAQQNADVVVVGYHWGIEYQNQPTSRQIYLGHMAVDSGADIVIGNHPHWIQPLEMYNGKPIIYSHGNFVFDQDWSLKTRQGLVSKFTFSGNKLTEIEFLPVQIDHNGQPYFLSGIEKQKILDEKNLVKITLSP